MTFAKSCLLGFNSVKFNSANSVFNSDKSFPKYNVLTNKNGDKTIVQFALAGYTKDDLTVELENGVLYVSGSNANMNQGQFVNNDFREVHRGIAQRAFSQSWILPKHAKIEHCEMKNGILSLWIVIEVPEEMKPKKITIQ